MTQTQTKIATIALGVQTTKSGSAYNQEWHRLTTWTIDEDADVTGGEYGSSATGALVIDMAMDNGYDGSEQDVRSGHASQGGWLVGEYLYTIRLFDADGNRIQED